MKSYPYHDSPRCGASTKRNDGSPCKSPAVRNKKRCRIHGGSLGSGAKAGNKNALKQGLSTREAKTFKKNVQQLLKSCRAKTVT
jgi:hypothetical protein